MSLGPVLTILNEIASTSSINKKKEIITTNRLLPGFRNTAVYAYHPLLQFNMLSIPGNHVGDLSQPPHQEIFTYLKHLSSKRGATSEERDHLDSLCVDKETLEVVNRILNKDLRCGAGAILFGTAFSIPNLEPMLCEDDLEKLLKKVEGDVTRLVWSIKLDGVRTRASLERPDGPVKYISRNGKTFDNFYVFDDEVSSICCAISAYLGDVWPIILDGEVISQDKDFQKQMTQVNRLKDVDPSIFRFKVFDVILPGQPIPLDGRLDTLSSVIDNSGIVSLLEHEGFEEGTTISDIINLNDRLCDEGEEGIVVKDKWSAYETGRSWKWTKVKKFHTEDLRVVGKEEGTGRHKGRLGALIVERPVTCYPEDPREESGTQFIQVKVGSGYSDEERDLFWTQPPDLIEVKYQNETKDGSLRFPVFVRVREDKRIL